MFIKDKDEEINSKLYNQDLEYIRNYDIFELDICQNHYAMGHIITPPEIIKAQGWAQIEAFISIKLKSISNL
ncbi:MAG: hypothetical protein KID00_11450 [Clostridium argentinense]|uniref:Uncharacterized protein n=1 Tax=Clostridium faecium TaxID=2762223 RepID=A0ABR8YTF5_9CLOT|nr:MULTISPECIES: hypothetical protein [Clostridium]MBD8047479.1 hypothetical protein [Clostridium faecium]MBS5824450.1 hypothetical protein [Clostridium argentinense]MDU1350535.1 hypothetical protein [Clostridium argentinense]